MNEKVFINSICDRCAHIDVCDSHKDNRQKCGCYLEQRPHGEWIPVGERLPEADKFVLICGEEGDIEVARGFVSTEIEEFVWLTSGWRFGEVIAWMPLPEPYREGDSDAQH